MPVTLYHKSIKAFNDYPYLVGGMAVAMTAGLGYGGYIAHERYKGRMLGGGRRLGSKGKVEDGMLKEAVGRSEICFDCEESHGES
jgi:hypothetical protein